MPSLTEQIEINRNRASAVDFGRLVQALAISKGNLGNALLATRRWRADAPRVVQALEAMFQCQATLDDLAVKAAVGPGTTTDTLFAGPLAPVFTLGSEFVTYMRPLHILGRLPVRRVPFNVRFARITSGATNARFVGQGVATPVHAQALDTLQLAYAKVSAIGVITDELARSQSYDAPALISADLAAAAATFLDEAFLDPDRAEVINESPASVSFGAAQIASTGLTAVELVTDAKAAMQVLDAAGVPLSECSWIMTQDVGIYISTLLTDTTHEPVFENFALDSGKWIGGLPVLVSGAVIGGNSPTEGLIVLVHPQSIAVADDDVATISITTKGSIAMDSAPASPTTQTSLWGQHFVGCKISRYLNWIRRRDGAVCTIRGLQV